MKNMHFVYVLSHGGIGTMLGQITNRQSLERDLIDFFSKLIIMFNI